MTSQEHLLPKTDPIFDAELKRASRRYAAGRVAELLAEHPTLTAPQLVDELRAEADLAEAEFKRLRDDD
ncbi:hypothetical protein [Brachybacterium hainanense]|uniref:Uncharacterized protein n=1 Tax=Brachybacterium hainanense TaxID=1541174 RepID=A0ABV6RC12_9MICO